MHYRKRGALQEEWRAALKRHLHNPFVMSGHRGNKENLHSFGSSLAKTHLDIQKKGVHERQFGPEVNAQTEFRVQMDYFEWTCLNDSSVGSAKPRPEPPKAVPI